MDEVVKKILDSIASPGDVAAFLLGYPLGFAIDAFFFPGGIGPATVGAVTGIGALGAKKAVDSIIATVQARRTKEPLELSEHDVLSQRSRKFEELLQASIGADDAGDEFQELLDALRHESQLWGAGVTSDEEFERVLTQATNDYRGTLRRMRSRTRDAQAGSG